MPISPLGRRKVSTRRGVLLLLVLSMLTLFLMIGILLLVMTTRTRATARAFSEATNTTSQSAIRQRGLLDEALMRLIRGPAIGQAGESILEDKYGRDSWVGELTQLRLPNGQEISSNSWPPVIAATVVGIPSEGPCGLAGRIITFLPLAHDYAPPTSYRILSVEGTRYLLSNLRLGSPAILPNSLLLPCKAIVNGRAFTPTPPRGRVVRFTEPTYDKLVQNATTAARDDVGYTEDSEVYWQYRADSQGNLTWTQASRNESYTVLGITFPQPPSDPWLGRLAADDAVIHASPPSFAGAGPIEVDNDNDGAVDGIWLAGIFPDDIAADGGTLRHSISYLVLDLDGKFNVNAHGSGKAGQVEGPGRKMGPADINAAGHPLLSSVWEAIISGTVPQPPTKPRTERRETPQLGVDFEVFGRVAVQEGGGVSADPYELDIGPNGPRGMQTGKLKGDTRQAPAESPYGVGELERVLRPFDNDASSLPSRLAILLGPSAELHRYGLSTDSWDTGGLLGPLVPRVLNAPRAIEIPEDVRQGLRFDINAPVKTEPQRKQYFTTLASLIQVVRSATGRSAEDVSDQMIAQWVANVIEFLDPDDAADTDEFLLGDLKVTGLEKNKLPADLPANKRALIPGPWNQESFVSEAELLGIPYLSLEDIEALADPPQEPIFSLVTILPELLDFVGVASPFNESMPSPTDARWREPGRINLNTCATQISDFIPGRPPTPKPESPAKDRRDLIKLLADEDFQELDLSAFELIRERVNQVLCTTTTRSNVFAVWITCRTENTMTGDRREHRLFAIIDRSIPVGLIDGMDLNAADTIRLKRFID